MCSWFGGRVRNKSRVIPRFWSEQLERKCDKLKREIAQEKQIWGSMNIFNIFIRKSSRDPEYASISLRVKVIIMS